MLDASRATVTTTATVVVPAGRVLRSRQITLRNDGTQTVFLGGDDSVTTASGFALPAGQTLPLDLEADEGLWGIVSSGSATVHVLR